MLTMIRRNTDGYAPSWPRFGICAAAGATAALSLLVLGTLGLPIAIVAGVVVSRRSLRTSWLGALAGVGALLLFVAYMQRRGPGTVCWHSATASGCDQYLNPWPWLIAGVLLVAVAVGAQLQLKRHRNSSPEDALL